MGGGGIDSTQTPVGRAEVGARSTRVVGKRATGSDEAAQAVGDELRLPIVERVQGGFALQVLVGSLGNGPEACGLRHARQLEPHEEALASSSCGDHSVLQ